MAGVGEVIAGRYRIDKVIGHGGMSTVYLATDTKLNKQWALKEIRTVGDAEQRDVIIKGLVNEANLLKGLNHPAIPRIVDLFQTDAKNADEIYIVMDYVEGRTLSRLVTKKGPQPEQVVADWGVQLCDVLDYLHRRNPSIIYRDVKPSNVMLTPDGAIRLIDFGIAREIPGKGTEGRTLLGDPRPLGTQGFGAPEQFEDGAPIDARTDVYALGATLFYLLTGVNPHTNPMKPIRQIDPSLSEGLEEVILRATQQDPNKRYADCAEMAYALRHYRDRDAAHNRAFKRRVRIFNGLVIAAVVCLVLGLACIPAGNASRNKDYDYWMQTGAQSTNDATAEQAYRNATKAKSDSIEPYEKLIALYENDGQFSTSEEQTFNTLIVENTQDLSKNSDNWGTLSYDTGLMYWYFYTPDSAVASASSSATSAEADEQARGLRVRAASQWMHNAADSTADIKDKAAVYAEIADFMTQIDAKIKQGTDSGYSKHFEELRKLVKNSQDETNPVMRLDVANLTLYALQTYPRNFRAEGISKDDMLALAQSAVDLAQGTTVNASDSTQENNRKRAIDSKDATTTAIENAFIDVTGQKGNEA